jgi:hypothetical protein
MLVAASRIRRRIPMFISRTLIAVIAAVACLTTGTASPALAISQTALACDSGPAAGPWRLPTQSEGTGIASGRLIDSTTNQTAYRLRALLRDVPTPCLSCLQGDIEGTLSDGVGPSPDFLVRGSYFGSFMGGSGQFRARVLRPSNLEVVGIITGDFQDLWGDGEVGRFLGDWRICP